jgi:hypothetical protein
LGGGVARKPKHEVVEAWGQRWGRKKHVRKREEEEEEEQTHEKHEESGHGAKRTDGVDGDEKERAETRDEN